LIIILDAIIGTLHSINYILLLLVLYEMDSVQLFLLYIFVSHLPLFAK